jgi:hypothetical protein
MTAARWAQQELLERYPRANLRIYAVWFNMYPGDARSKWPATLLTDSRVAHYWDEQRAVGQLYLLHLPAMLPRRAEATLAPAADAMWDTFFLYAPDDRWETPVPLPISWGYPIMVTRERLLHDVDALVKPR